MTVELKTTPLHGWHVEHGGRMVDFSGWSMPVQYSSIIDEHHAARKNVGLFDVSHMARFRVAGADARQFVDGLVTRKVAALKPGQVRYSLVCDESGGILDDILVYYLEDSTARDPYVWLVVNAGNRQKIWDWFQSHLPSAGIELEDRTEATAMIAVQGPQAMRIADSVAEASLAQLAYYRGLQTEILAHTAIVSRTGYTGEDGVEITVPAAAAESVWCTLMEEAEKVGGRAAGLGARDTLRLEAAMPLYGHELSESIHPLSAGLDFAVSWDHEFVGKAALQSAREEPFRRRVGLVIEGRRAAREEYRLFSGDQEIGVVTSGTVSPTLEKPIAMGYVDPAFSSVGTRLEVDIRGKRTASEVVPLPFYRRS